MRVTYNGVDLGGTTDSVTISKKIDMADVMVDQYGKTPIDKKVSGYAYSIKFTLAEVKNKANWKVVFPSDSLVTSGPNSAISADMNIGDSLYARAQLLVLHPLEATNGDLSEDYNFPKAASIQTSEVKYGPEKQTGLSVEIIVFPNLGVSPPHFFTYGDPSIGTTPASAAGPVAGSNTGNGTITNVAVFNGVTKTETITVLFLDGGGTGNNYIVTGSISGALGYGHVNSASSSTSNFVPNPANPQVITFTVTQGTVEFVANDSFTIATTASNFV
jgi:hypothetical protein